MSFSLTADMRKVLRDSIRGIAPSFSRATFDGLKARALMNEEGELTNEGWKQSVTMLPLKEQCQMMGIVYEKINGLKVNGNPEYAVWNYFSSSGYTGAFCEGGPVLLLIRAAALDVLTKLNTFSSRQDACSRFTEAQLLIQREHAELILKEIRSTSSAHIVNGFKEIYASLMVQECYPRLTSDIMVSLFDVLGRENLAKITEAILEDPYRYRAGWPDLTMTNGKQMLWAEVKTTDRLHMSQVSTLYRMRELLPGAIRVIQVG